MAKVRVDPQALQDFLEAGHSQADAAKHFGVSEAAISQRVKQARIATSKVVALERAAQVVEQKLTAAQRLQHVERVILDQLTLAEQQAKQPGADRAALSDVIVKLSAEVRAQLRLEHDISRTLIDLRVVREFQRTLRARAFFRHMCSRRFRKSPPRRHDGLSRSSRNSGRCAAAWTCPPWTKRVSSVWRDPLDELIDDLERALPASPVWQEDLPRLVDIQRAVAAIFAHADGRGPDPSSDSGSEKWWRNVRVRTEQRKAHPKQGPLRRDRTVLIRREPILNGGWLD